MNIIIVDYNASFRNALKKFLEIEHNCIVIADVESYKELIQLRYLTCADVILIDISSDLVNCLQSTKKVINDYNKLNFVAISCNAQNVSLRDIIESGFKGLVDKNDIYNSIAPTLKQVMKGQYVFPASISL